MFFIVSKLLYFLIIPFTWVVLLLLWAWFTKKQRLKKRLFILIIIIAAVFTNPFLFRTSLLWLQSPKIILPAGKTYEAGVVLGGFSGYDKYNNGHFGENADRFIQTANLYHRGIIKKIIISGGSGLMSKDALPETIFLRAQFIENGVPDSALILETRSRNTYENALFTKEFVDSLQLQQPLVLVTSAFHMRRSMSCFTKVGLKCIAFPCDYKIVPQRFSLEETILPDIALLYKWTIVFKELIGLKVYKMTGKA